MAYNGKKVIIYGIAGVILAFAVLAFLPTHTETHIAMGVNLDLLPEYGIQIIKIAETPVEITNLVINIPAIEAQDQNGEWVQVSTDEQQWDLRHEPVKTFTVDQSITGYSRIRFYVASGIDKSNVTLNNGQVVPLGVPSIPLEVNLRMPLSDAEEDFELVLSLTQGKASNYIIPNAQIEISTNKIIGEILVK